MYVSVGMYSTVKLLCSNLRENVNVSGSGQIGSKAGNIDLIVVFCNPRVIFAQ